MELPGAGTVIVRHGEIGTKSAQVQAKMERQLGSNLERQIGRHDIDGTVRIDHGRLFIRTPEPQRVTTLASETFGVISASAATEVSPTENAILASLETIAQTVYTAGTFAVRVRRAGPSEAHPFTSKELEERAGSAIWNAVEPTVTPEVDLDDPDITFYVECREDAAYLYLTSVAGPGGFPLGTQGTVVSLISGGTDSPVAAWEMMSRGCTLLPVYFDFESYGGQDHVARVMATIRQLAAYTPSGELELIRLPIGEKVETLVESTHDTRMLSLRRLMFALASEIAKERTAIGISTGESIGQKSSQTGANLAATATATPYPIHRPLLNYDKEEIISQAKAIGTYEESSIVAGCNRVAPSFPQTAATVADVIEAEPTGLLDDLQTIIERGETVNITVDTHEASNPSPIVGANQ